MHIESLLGASHRQIRWQLFADTFLMVISAFLLSILLMSDLLAVFNATISAHLSFSYLFSVQVFPVILLFVIILSVVPAEYMSRKIQTLSESRYRSFFTGRKKQRIVAALVTLQFMISIGLLSAFMIIRSQMDLIEQEGSRYKGIVEFGIGDSRQSPLFTWIEDVKSIPGVKSVVASKSGLYTMSMAVPRQNGEKNDLLMLELYENCPDLLDIYDFDEFNASLGVDQVWDNATYTRNWYGVIYRNLMEYSETGSEVNAFKNPWSNLCGEIASEKASSRDVMMAGFTAASGSYHRWATFYKDIRQAMIFIERAHDQGVGDPSSTNKLTAEEIARMKDECRFMIAYYYFSMFELYGPACIVTEIDDAAEPHITDYDRATVDEMVNHIDGILAPLCDPAQSKLPESVITSYADNTYNFKTN